MQLTATFISFVLCTLINTISSSPQHSTEPFIVHKAIQSPNPDLQQRDSAAIDFNRTTPSSKTYIQGHYLQNFSQPPSHNATLFLANQTTHILHEWLYYYPPPHNSRKKNDGPLPYDGIWMVTSSSPSPTSPSPPQPNPPETNIWDFGLYIRPVAGQKLTFGILYSAVLALQGEAHVEGTLAPMDSRKAFTFDVFDGGWGLVGQGVLIECEDGELVCFEPFE